jgi:hypothetical protein
LSLVKLFFEFYKLTTDLDFLNITEGAEFKVQLDANKLFTGDLLNISISRDINNIIQTANINDLPYEGVYQYISKYDRFTVYYEYYDIIEKQQTTVKLFEGEVVKKNTKYNIDSHSISLEIMSKCNILSRINTSYQSAGESLQQYVSAALEKAGLSSYIGTKFKMTNDMLGRFNPSGKLIEELKEIREKYAVLVFEDEDNDIVVATPQVLRGDTTTVLKYDFDVYSYPISIDIDNTYADINAILALGFSTKNDKTLGYGVAFDPLNYRMNGGKLNWRIEYAFEITGGFPALSQFALSKLLEEAKQFKITISNIPFDTRFRLGQLVTIKNHPEINPDQLFMIEKINEDINNDDAKVTLVVSGFSLGVVPEDILDGNAKAFGALNPDVNLQLSTLHEDTTR